ncbi:MFS transporter [Curtobacterium sp. MCPF17_052]|uniref:MFS transporter n=1 Tax=Curtobacterium sp. MCPF17_052 TaxID=2175655 RepID=UPI0024E016B9|nr:MFS transporter [Curtobacterium sp. MCPF17_052]WIB13889.1 MFS transporter [Curtobacterium sp. MCPF17_052]
MLLVSVASSAVPSPIYPVYAAEWHLTPLMLTAVFAIYVAGLLLSLLVAGRLSDHVGRKPVLIVGGLGVAVSLGLFAVADGLGALIVDRIVQGVSVGLLIGALGAALIDNSLERHPSLAGVLNGVIPPIALATGALSSGALVEWGPAPEQLVYVLFGSLLVLLVVALAVVPEQVVRRPGALRSLRPTVSVPRASRRLFRSVAGSLVSSWALGGLFLSLVPSALGVVFGIHNHFAAGALIAVVTGVGALTGLAIQRMDTRKAVLIGLVALVLGPVVTVTFVFVPSLPGLVVGSAIAGVGFGAGFQAPLRMLLATAAPHTPRGTAVDDLRGQLPGLRRPERHRRVPRAVARPRAGARRVRRVHRPGSGRRPRAAGDVEGRRAGRGSRGGSGRTDGDGLGPHGLTRAPVRVLVASARDARSDRAAAPRRSGAPRRARRRRPPCPGPPRHASASTARGASPSPRTGAASHGAT